MFRSRGSETTWASAIMDALLDSLEQAWSFTASLVGHPRVAEHHSTYELRRSEHQQPARWIIVSKSSDWGCTEILPR